MYTIYTYVHNMYVCLYRYRCVCMGTYLLAYNINTFKYKIHTWIVEVYGKVYVKFVMFVPVDQLILSYFLPGIYILMTMFVSLLKSLSALFRDANTIHQC